MRVLVLQNCDIEDFGLYVAYMQQRGIKHDVVQANRPDAEFGSAKDYGAIFVGGTPISVWEADQHAFLQREQAFLEEAVSEGLPCFGICGGGQLIARVLGAEVRKNPEMEIGCYEVRLTPEGQRDPLLRGFPPRFPVFQWHGDTFNVPQGGSLLAEGGTCRNQLFRLGKVVAVQFHLEVTAETAAVWADRYADELQLVDKDASMVVEAWRRHEGQASRLCDLLLENFFALVSQA